MCVSTVPARLTAQTHLADAAQARRGAVQSVLGRRPDRDRQARRQRRARPARDRARARRGHAAVIVAGRRILARRCSRARAARPRHHRPVVVQAARALRPAAGSIVGGRAGAKLAQVEDGVRGHGGRAAAGRLADAEEAPRAVGQRREGESVARTVVIDRVVESRRDAGIIGTGDGARRLQRQRPVLAAVGAVGSARSRISAPPALPRGHQRRLLEAGRAGALLQLPERGSVHGRREPVRAGLSSDVSAQGSSALLVRR